MVITKLNGGLGNQMFQYAAGRRLAHMSGTDLKLDISGFTNYKLRIYNLEVLNIKENFAAQEEIIALTIRKRGITERVINRLLRRPPRPASTHIREKHFHFDPDILNLTDNVYLDGYWQTEKYFIDISEIICQEFTLKTPQTGKNKELAQLIESCESVSIHIRRGDFISNTHTNQVHGSCDLNYYFSCIEQLTKTVMNPHFFIFSDEPEWARNNLKFSYPAIFIDHNNAEKSYEDLRLMSQCKHNIIANSSFSWWGAWLNRNTSKIIMAPKKWFNNNSRDSKDIISDKWIKI